MKTTFTSYSFDSTVGMPRFITSSLKSAEHLVSDFPEFDFTKGDVVRAGNVLRGDIPWDERNRENIEQAFRVANGWIQSHFYPMTRMRNSLVGRIRRSKISGKTVTRLKSMSSTRKKLNRLKGNLDRIQDLGGCRIIVDSIDDVDYLAADLKVNFGHEFEKENDYIKHPKNDGYRSYHLVYKYVGSGLDLMYSGRRVELQLRSILQHSWATAVEAVGLYRNEDLKGGQGDSNWLNFFSLVSAELAALEDTSTESAAAVNLRISEIRKLNKHLNAFQILENMRHVVKYSETYYVEPNYKPKYFLIEFDKVKRAVKVEGYDKPLTITETLDELVLLPNKYSDDNKINVIVEADKIDLLKYAYPNYYLDVRRFLSVLNGIVEGRNSIDYKLKAQPVSRVNRENPVDIRWLNRRGMLEEPLANKQTRRKKRKR